MKNLKNSAFKNSIRVIAVASLAMLMTGCGMMEKVGLGGSKPTTTLSGANEVPAVTTKASGKSTITVADDRTVSGSVIIDDMVATAAHIHRGAAGQNGPVTIPLSKTSDKVFSVPANTRLTDAQYADYKAGNLYINVHSTAHPAGEIRVQLKP